LPPFVLFFASGERTSVVSFLPNTVYCTAAIEQFVFKSTSNMVENKPDAVESALEKMTPFLTNVTFGGMMGYTTGYAMKKISKAVAFFVGVTFVALQTGVYCGYIEVDWLKIKDSAFQKIDAVRFTSLSEKIGFLF
jgi:uncharacterized membrane protein (Fun14 family)